MVMIEDKKKKNYLEFFVDRLKRIFPLYGILTTLIALILIFAPNYLRSSSYDFLQLVTSYFFVSWIFGYHYPTLYVGWSLELEMLFYLIFSFTLIFNKIILKNKVLIFSIIFIFLGLFTHINLIIFEFIFGALIYFLSKNLNKKSITSNYNKYFFYIILFLIIIIISQLELPIDIYRFIYWGIPASIILICALYYPTQHPKWIIYIGNASYSIYLIQVFTLPFFTKIVNILDPSLSSFIVFINNIIFTIICGCIMYEILEKKLIKFFS